MPINKREITKEQIEKAMQCKTADDLMAYAKSEGIDITREEAGKKRKLILRSLPT